MTPFERSDLVRCTRRRHDYLQTLNNIERGVPTQAERLLSDTFLEASGDFSCGNGDYLEPPPPGR
jgi:hypothetical protein